MTTDTEDLLAHLSQMGFGPLLDALRDPEMYTANRGKPVIRRIAARLGISQAQTVEMYTDLQDAVRLLR